MSGVCMVAPLGGWTVGFEVGTALPIEQRQQILTLDEPFMADS